MAPHSPPDAHRVDVSVIIVNFNVRAFLQQALQSVQRSTQGLAMEIFVVDNHSVDGSCAMVQTEFPEVQLIANKDNAGFAKANNQAIVRAHGRYLFILNPDTIVEESTVGTLVSFLDAHPEAAAVGCQILNPDGSFAPESRRAFPTPAVAFFRMTGLSRLFPRSRIFGRYNLGYLPRNEVAEVDALSGSCMMVRKAAISYSASAYRALAPADRLKADSRIVSDVDVHGGAGTFDEGYFMYGEDLDWCYRFQQCGWKIYYTPDTSIIHYKGESTRKNQLRYVRLFYGAMIRFARKHLSQRYPPFLLWLLRTAVVGRGFLFALLQGMKHRATQDGAVVFGVMAGLGLFRSLQLGLAFPEVYYWLIAPSFALIAVTAIGLLGGYQYPGRRLGSMAGGVALAVLLLAAASFFVKSIAFSRAVVLASLPASVVALAALRRVRPPKVEAPRRTLFVGIAREAERLNRALKALKVPPYRLLGFVCAEERNSDQAIVERNRSDSDGLRYLGTIRELRELVQAHEARAVVFASASLSNKTIFTLLQRLSGLTVESRILAQNYAHVIGKSSVDLLENAALLEAQEAVGYMRSALMRRLFDSAIALLGALAHPLVVVIARIPRTRPYWRTLAGRTRQWREVLAGRRALVGYHTGDGFIPPSEWALRPGIFAVTESLGSHSTRSREDAEQVYWSYVRRQSAVVDWLIVVRAIRLMQ